MPSAVRRLSSRIASRIASRVLDAALNHAGVNYISRYTDHLDAAKRLSVLEAARQAQLAPDPVCILDHTIKICKVDSRPLAALAYVQKFRTFAFKYCDVFNEDQPFTVSGVSPCVIMSTGRLKNNSSRDFMIYLSMLSFPIRMVQLFYNLSYRGAVLPFFLHV